jgi:probable F420-dependent oxidoreductase
MKVGVVYPQIELGGNPESLRHIGTVADQLGYDHFLMYDHVVGAVHENRTPPLWKFGPYTDKDPFHDPLVAFAYLAGITDNINFVTGILILPQRQTVLVAQQAADLDLVSGGRLHLGVGTGWNYVEYDALGQDFATRGKRLSEQIPYLRRLWAEPLVTFKGQFDSIDRGNINPRPHRQIPIYCGGFSEPAFKRAARLADGFIFGADLDESVLPQWTRLQELLAMENRPVECFKAYCLLQDRYANGLPIPRALDAMRRWRDAGGTHASVVTMGLGYTEKEQHLDHFRQLSEKLREL